jgi:hypothetical protein
MPAAMPGAMIDALTFAGPPGAIDELGIWTPRELVIRPRESGLESVGVAASPLEAARPAAGVLRWEQDLVAADQVAPAALARERLVVAARALPQAEARAAVFGAGGGQVAAVAAELAGPEQELRGWARLAQMGGDALARLPDFREAAEQVGAFFEKVREALRNYARVITRLAGVVVAVTEVTWTGDFRAAWGSGLRVDDAARHQAAVALALRTRDTWLRLAATVLRGAAQLAALFALNPLLALPAAYRFARQVIEQAQALQLTGTS